MAERKSYPLRLDPEIYDALRRWAEDGSLQQRVNAQIEFLLSRAPARETGRAPKEKRETKRGEE